MKKFRKSKNPGPVQRGEETHQTIKKQNKTKQNKKYIVEDLGYQGS